MNVSEIITELNNHGFEDTSEEQKLFAINDTLWDIESRQDWPWLIKSQNLTFTGSSATPTNVASDFKAIKWLYDTTSAVSLFHMRLEEFRDKHQSQVTEAGNPVLFYFVGETLNLWPVPPASTTRFVMDYFSMQPEVNAATLEAAINLPPRHHRIITLGAVAKLYQLEDDAELAQVFKGDYEQRLATMTHDIAKFQFVNPDHIFVIDEDDEWAYPAI